MEEQEAVEIIASVLRGNYPLAEAVLAALVKEGIVDELELPDHMRSA